MYERFWHKMGEKSTIVISGHQSISYFSDVRNLCWFLEPEFANSVVRLHKLVGNAITEDHHIVVGTGSTQLFQAVLYALSPPNASEPMNVVSAAPFYSSYPLLTDYLKSALYKWAGDAYEFSKDGPYIELVTSPNNPDGFTREPVVRRTKGLLVHDLAYYWPQYTPISFPADHDIMLFTVSKSTGHAGIRLGKIYASIEFHIAFGKARGSRPSPIINMQGRLIIRIPILIAVIVSDEWALVKDREIAKKMINFIELNTIGVSRDSQLRAAKILQAVSESYDHVDNSKETEPFFEYGYNIMAKRWKQLRAAVNKSKLFSLPDFPPGTCTFTGRTFESQPGNFQFNL
ncbi:unnamed protein product [Ilex paraguariensis]|uniref:Alliinase C-terminal domain-containing protein n=1 Tax=Ilex paraguariensis TaxID=185542 RepID=A0ABC8R0T6_9AQUA